VGRGPGRLRPLRAGRRGPVRSSIAGAGPREGDRPDHGGRGRQLRVHRPRRRPRQRTPPLPVVPDRGGRGRRARRDHRRDRLDRRLDRSTPPLRDRRGRGEPVHPRSGGRGDHPGRSDPPGRRTLARETVLPERPPWLASIRPESVVLGPTDDTCTGDRRQDPPSRRPAGVVHFPRSPDRRALYSLVLLVQRRCATVRPGQRPPGGHAPGSRLASARTNRSWRSRTVSASTVMSSTTAAK